VKFAAAVFFLSFIAAAAPQKLAPEFSLGTSGNASLQFRNPGALLVAGNFIYVADEGNGRIQKLSGDGAFVSQTGRWPGKWHGIASMASDLAGMIYAAGRRDSGVVQFDADLLPVSVHAVPSGFLCYEKSGDFLICLPERAGVLRWRMEGRQIQDVTAAWIGGRPPVHCALWNKLFWILDKQTLRVGDLLGPMKTAVRLNKPVGKGFLCPSADRMLIILGRSICEFRDGNVVTLGQLPDNVLPGGAAAMGNRLWISDRAGNRLLRFILPMQDKTP